MKLFAAAKSLVDYKKSHKSLKALKEAGFVGVWIDYSDVKDPKFDALQAVCTIRNACMDLQMEYIEKSTSGFNFNTPKEVNGHFVRDAKNEPEAINAAVQPGMFCYDVGYGNLCGIKPYEYILAVRKSLGAIIFRDNDGVNDDHLMPYTCVSKGQSKTDWLSIIKALREIEFDGILIMDFSDTAAALPDCMVVSAIPLAEELAKYFIWQIEMKSMLRRHPKLVLFGAGNMCRNYMKCYGEEFRPLFTCDNNNARWGQTFEGLEIKSPEALKELDADTAIVLCNVYYDEIEAQIRAMGLPNPIERFNDEIMPSFYTDRLEMWEGGASK